MHRRIQLIDADRDFERTLSEQLGPYGFESLRMPEGADALARVPQIEPVVIFIAVDEPDKLGYSLCNKAKKGVAAQIPVVLITSSVTPEGFANHRKLKIHADEYIDKRTMSSAELIGMMDNLVGLGELLPEADLSIPVEVDDMSLDLGDDDMVVDEIDAVGRGDAVDDFAADAGHDFTAGAGHDFSDDAAGDFADDASNRTVLSPPGALASLIDAETDAAFAALTGIGDDPAASSAAP